MLALLFIAVAWAIGILLFTLATGGVASWHLQLFPSGGLNKQASHFFTLLAAGAGSLWTGLLFLTWLVYLIAWLTAKVFPTTDSVHPLLPANLTAFIVVLVIIVLNQRKRKITISLVKMPRKRELLFITATLLSFLVFSCWLMLTSFISDSNTVSAGYTVFSDFAPHTAMVSSFSTGRNWPTNYPHYAGDGISYHFMFFFLCGNLAWLGLPIGAAINIPSILGMFSFLILLGVLGVILTRRMSVFILAPVLTLARSSMAFFTWLSDQLKRNNNNFESIFAAMRFQRTFIGNTPRDDWGLWTINVYANQRHLLPAIALMFFVLLLFLPQISNKSFRKTLFARDHWLGYAGTTNGAMLLASAILFCFAYWHGSVLIAVISVLAVMALFSRARLYYLIAAALAVAGALLQVSFFTSAGNESISLRLLWGFIAEDKSFTGVLKYLLELTGIVLPLTALTFLLPGRNMKIVLAAGLMPLVIAFTFSLTPDVTVNHKFIMISQMMLNIGIAALLAALWQKKTLVFGDKRQGMEQFSNHAQHKIYFSIFARRLTAVFLAFMLTITGVAEWRIFANANQGQYSIFTETPLNEWVRDETRPDAVFITPPWHYNSFFLTGRSVWLGHSYYAWSAGHNTGGRLQEQQDLLSGEMSPEQIRDYAAINDIDYLLINDELRTHEQFSLDEQFFLDNFSMAMSFDDELNTSVYFLSQS